MLYLRCVTLLVRLFLEKNPDTFFASLVFSSFCFFVIQKGHSELETVFWFRTFLKILPLILALFTFLVCVFSFLLILCFLKFFLFESWLDFFQLICRSFLLFFLFLLFSYLSLLTNLFVLSFLS